MDPQQIDSILKTTLSDYRVSRGEKKIVRDLLEECGADEQQRMFLSHRAFEIIRQEYLDANVDPQLVQALGWLEDMLKVLRPIDSADADEPSADAYFSPGDSCSNKILQLLRTVQRQADICVFTITDDRITEEILRTHDRGVSLRIISDNDKSNDLGSDIDRLRRRGVPVRIDQTEYHMHHKFAVFDRQRLLTGSYNWTRSAARHNEENVVVVEEPRLLTAFLKQFQKLWESLG